MSKNTESTKEISLIKSYNLTLADIPNILGLFYLFAIGIGMLFTYQKYSQFGINIFDYADVFDFLIAPFADFTILIFTIASMVLVYTLYLFDSWWSRIHPTSYTIGTFGMNKIPGYSTFKPTMALLSLIVYLYFASTFYGEMSRRIVKEQETISIRFSDNETKTGVIIGKTNEIMFFLKGDNVTAIPITSLVKEFEIK